MVVGGEAKIASVAAVDASWSYDADAEYQLQGSFPEHRSVCMKPEELIASRDNLSSGTVSYELRPVEGLLVIDRIAN